MFVNTWLLLFHFACLDGCRVGFFLPEFGRICQDGINYDGEERCRWRNMVLSLFRHWGKEGKYVSRDKVFRLVNVSFSL